MYGHRWVVYKAELGCIHPHTPLYWTGVDCTDASVVLWFKKNPQSLHVLVVLAFSHVWVRQSLTVKKRFFQVQVCQTAVVLLKWASPLWISDCVRAVRGRKCQISIVYLSKKKVTTMTFLWNLQLMLPVCGFFFLVYSLCPRLFLESRWVKQILYNTLTYWCDIWTFFSTILYRYILINTVYCSTFPWYCILSNNAPQ